MPKAWHPARSGAASAKTATGRRRDRVVMSPANRRHRQPASAGGRIGVSTPEDIADARSDRWRAAIVVDNVSAMEATDPGGTPGDGWPELDREAERDAIVAGLRERPARLQLVV